MKHVRYIGILLLLWLGAGTARAQSAGPPPLEPDPRYRVKTIHFAEYETSQGDTTYHFRMSPVPVFGKILVDRDKHWRLIRNVKIVYPIAKYANDKLREMETTLGTLEGERRQQERYTKTVEKELKEQYTPIIKRMSFSQGKVLIKLIDRETGRTSYQLVREIRGKFSAFFWQNLGRVFGMNLKSTYDAAGEDQLLEQIIVLYEAGLL